MDSKEYWQRREDENTKHYIKQEEEYDRQIEKIYDDMLDSIQKEIDGFYGRYASREGITIAEAKKRVSKLDIEEYERKAKRYVEDAARDRKANGGKTNYKGYYFSDKANEEMRLYNLTMKVNRLEMLKANIGLEMIKGHAELETFMGEILQGRTEEELKRQAGILGNTIKDNAKLAHTIPNASFHNATFSDRIWMYHDVMKADLSKLLQTGLIQGKNSRQLARELRKYYHGDERLKNGRNGAIYNTERLMRTEMARVQTEAQRQSFIENGFTQYMFIANSGCCADCQANNGKVFDVEKMMPGDNAPPVHPHCRCSTAAHRSREEFDAMMDYIDRGGTMEGWGQGRHAEWLKQKNGGKAVAKSSGNGIISLRKPLRIDMQYFAKIPPDKINKFLLKPGAKHSKEFFDVGYKESDYELLVNDLLNGFSNGEIVDRIVFSNDVERFSIFMQLGVKKKKRFRSVWQKDTPESEPRLITAHRED